MKARILMDACATARRLRRAFIFGQLAASLDANIFFTAGAREVAPVGYTPVA